MVVKELNQMFADGKNKQSFNMYRAETRCEVFLQNIWHIWQFSRMWNMENNILEVIKLKLKMSSMLDLQDKH